MLAAMARGARTQYANRVNLLSLPFTGTNPYYYNWTVPAGVTSVNVFAFTNGGGAGTFSGGASQGTSGGGGGGAIVNVPLTVTPGDVLQLTNTVTLTAPVLYTLTLRDGAAVELFTIESGHDFFIAPGQPYDGAGATVTWYQGGTVTAVGGTAAIGLGGIGGNGGNGQKVACLGGWLISGGGGGRGGTLFPVQAGGKGGDAGDFAGILDGSVAGGGGGGFYPGLYYRGNTTLQPGAYQTSELWLEYN